MVDFILSIAASQQLPVDALWLTPKDVIKRAKTLNLIQQSRVIAPNRWLIRALSEQVDPVTRDALKKDIDEQRPIRVDKFTADGGNINLQLAMAYQGYLIESKQFGNAADRSPQYEQALQYRSQLRQLFEEKYSNTQLEAKAFKSPLDTPQDSQLEFGILNRGKNNFLRMSFTPASHHLEDDNRQYFGESELLLFEVSALKNTATRQLIIDRFILYFTKSLIPYDDMSGGLSGAIRVGYEPQRNAEFKTQRAAFISGAIGKTSRYGRDIDMFALLGGGASVRNRSPNFYLQPEVGIIVREIFGMKTSASAILTTNLFGDHARYVKYRFVQSKYFSKQNISLHLVAESESQGRNRQHFFETNIKYLF